MISSFINRDNLQNSFHQRERKVSLRLKVEIFIFLVKGPTGGTTILFRDPLSTNVRKVP